MKGYEIRQLMKDNGVMPKTIAEDAKVTRSTVSCVIHGKSKSARIQKAIAEAVNRKVTDIWPEPVNR